MLAIAGSASVATSRAWTRAPDKRVWPEVEDLAFLRAFSWDVLTAALCSPVQGSAAHTYRTLRFRGRVLSRIGGVWGYPDASIDLVVSSTSFDHWTDQYAGLGECARVLRPGGHLVLVDQFSLWLLPTLAASRRGKARTRGRANRLLLRAGFDRPHWHRLHAVIINAAVAAKRS
jgi:SAM-dependent methyltransferase